MSFFNDFLNEIGVDKNDNEETIQLKFDRGLKFIGKYKIQSMQDYEIVILVKKQSFKFYGEKLKIKSMSKGELLITGNIHGVIKL